MPPPTVRPATEADIPAITVIYNEAVGRRNATCDLTEQGEEERLWWLRTHDERHPVVVAVEDERVLGWSSLSPYSSKEGYRLTVEDSVYLAETAQGRGLGRLLLAHLVGRAGELSYRAILARVIETNQASLGLHREFGFIEWGRLREVAYLGNAVGFVDVVELGLLL